MFVCTIYPGDPQNVGKLLCIYLEIELSRDYIFFQLFGLRVLRLFGR